MPQHSPYSIPRETIQIEQEIKRSRFIATVGHAADKSQANQFIDEIRQAYPDARHHCWAYIIGNPHDSVINGMSDDGEPQGTAGRPMLQVLQYRQLGEIVAVVSRYFGGIKLGAGGLVRAYSSSVQLALQELPMTEVVATRRVQLTFPYAFENTIRHLLEGFKIAIALADYQEAVVLHLDIPYDIYEELSIRIKNQTHGQVLLRNE